MSLSSESRDAVIDLIENRLSVMHVGDRDDLRQIVALKRALAELRGLDAIECGMLKSISHIPTRGRHRKVEAMKDEMLGEAI